MVQILLWQIRTFPNFILWEKNQNLWYAYGHTYTYNYKSGFIPPFQLVIPDTVESTGLLPGYFDFINIYPQSYPIGFQINSQMISDHGMTVEKFDDDYIIVKNPSTAILNVPDWNPLDRTARFLLRVPNRRPSGDMFSYRCVR